MQNKLTPEQREQRETTLRQIHAACQRLIPTELLADLDQRVREALPPDVRCSSRQFRRLAYGGGRNSDGSFCISQVLADALLTGLQALQAQPHKRLLSHSTAALTLPRAQQREATFQALQCEVKRLTAEQHAADVARRLKPLLSSAATTRSIAQRLNAIKRGEFKLLYHPNQNYLMGQRQAEEWLGCLRRLTPEVGLTHRSKLRAAHIASGLFVPPSVDPAPGDLLRFAAQQVGAWVASGVSTPKIAKLVAAHGCTINYSKLSKLYLHGPYREDRADCYLTSPQVAVSLVTALVKLGRPTTAQAAD